MLAILADPVQDRVAEPTRGALPNPQRVVGGARVQQQPQVAPRLDDLRAAEEGDARRRDVRHAAAREGAGDLLAVPVDRGKDPDRRRRSGDVAAPEASVPLIEGAATVLVAR